MAKRKRDSKPSQNPKKRVKRVPDPALVGAKGYSQPRITHPVLIYKYQRVCTLETYLCDHLPSCSRTRRRRVTSFDAEHPQHAGFLQSTLVGIVEPQSDEDRSGRHQQFRDFTQTQYSRSNGSGNVPSCGINEVVDFVVWTLFQRDAALSKKPRHILTHGLQRSSVSVSENENAGTIQIPGVIQVHPNASITWLKSTPWTYLMTLLGKDSEIVISNLLLDCGLFQRLQAGKDNYYQVSGVPVNEVKSQATSQKNIPLKCPKDFVINHLQSARKPSEITLVRNRIFYAKPSINKRGNIALGLKHIHVLNRLPNLHDKTQDLRLLCYIFPRQFGLHNVFTSSVDKKETTQPFKDYTIRDEEIAGSCNERKMKIPRRLRGLPLNLIRSIRRNHLRCSYSQLLRRYCPVQAAEHSLIAAVDEKTMNRTTYSDTSSTESQESIKDQSSFLRYATPMSQVSLFCQSVLRQLLPRNVFGGTGEGGRNCSIIQASVLRFVCMRRFETLSLHQIMNNLKLTSIPWLIPSKTTVDSKMSISDKQKREEILQEFVYYVFDSLLIPIIRSNFYVTESGVHRSRLFYFRHDVWRRLSEPSFLSMRMSNLKPLSARQVRLSQVSNNLGYSQVRLLPKERGTRPITNLRRRAMRTFNGKVILSSSINAQLTPVFNVINYERFQNPQKLASSLFSVGDIHGRLKAFKTGILGQKDSPLYFVKVDIRSAFDTIPQDNLLSVINESFQANSYKVGKHVEAKWLAQGRRSANGQIVTRFVGGARPNDGSPVFSASEADALASRKRRMIFSGNDHEKIWTVFQLKKLLKSHIRGNLVKIGRKHFTQTEGIPQGSILSSFLCNFFYADFEKFHLGFLDPASTLLLRLIDDFLLITVDRTQAVRFIETMVEGAQHYGININPEKTLVNFDVAIQGSHIPRLSHSSLFPYCGMAIDTRTLQVSKERQRKDSWIANALTVDVHGRAGVAFRRRILAALRIQLHTILLDPSLNSKERIMRTLLECFAETAMKLHQYRLGMNSYKRPDQKLIISIIDQMVSLVVAYIHKQRPHETSVVTKTQVRWLAAAAFSQILLPKQTQYQEILRWLAQMKKTTEQSMNIPRNSLEQLVKNSLGLFTGYRY